MPGDGPRTKPISLFYSYSHKDEELRNELADHLVPLERAGLIEVWHDREMLAGDTVDEEIARKLQTADLVLVLIDPSFIRSKYCYDIEMTKAIERHRRGEARVVPVVVRPCQWQLTPLKELLAMPTDGRAVTEWPNRDTAFNDVAKAITKLARTMQRTGNKEADPAVVGAKPAPTGQVGGGLLTPSTVLPDFAVFRDIDAPWCPEMVALPAGEFLMGSPKSEEGRDDSEGPQHWVTIDYRFAMGRYPVTFAEYDRFCDMTKCEKPEDEGWGRGRRPVINVSWHDAQAYCGWLAKETGKPYRLPSEAEWEYACRAGTTRPLSFGKRTTEKDANFGWNVGKTTEVGSFPTNPWGLYDMPGNVWEWCADHWHDNYVGAPADGSALIIDAGGTGDGAERVLRGGSWNSGARTVRHYNFRQVRSASRDAGDPGFRNDGIGFRCVQVLS